MRVVSSIKRRLVPAGKRSRVIAGGAFKGISMELDLTYQGQLFWGTFERETASWLKRLSRGVRTAVDIGAAEGEHTLYFLLRTAADKVVSFEPGPVQRAQLMANLAANQISQSPRLVLSERLVGAEVSESTTSLDAIVGDVHLPCLVKMDVDGMEVEILNGATAFLRRDLVRWLIETHSPALERECVAILQREGFATRVVPNAWWRGVLPEQRGLEQNRWLVAARLGDMDLR
jgi:hypothetical protein